MPLFGYWYERFPLVSSINDDTNVWGGVVGQDLKSFTDALSSWFGFGVKRAIFHGSHVRVSSFFFFFFSFFFLGGGVCIFFSCIHIHCGQRDVRWSDCFSHGSTHMDIYACFSELNIMMRTK